MNYKPRLIEKIVKKMAQSFKIVLIVGPRQVGKSTLLKQLFPQYRTFVFDQHFDQYGVRTDPDILNNFTGPLILDEVQYVPELISALKRRVDQSDQMGQYFLTGSHNLAVLREVAESMADAFVFFELPCMTLYEEFGHISGGIMV